MNFKTMLNELDRTLLTFPESKDRRRYVYFGLLAAMYVWGFRLWSAFFNYGAMQFNTGDWAEKLRALTLLTKSISRGVIPYHATGPLSVWHLPPPDMPPRFLALPHIIVSPQVVLTQWMDPGHFFLFDIRLFYTLGFLGCLLIILHRRLSAVAAFVFFLLFNLNGYVTSHIGIGHSEWIAYFLFSFVIYFTMQLIDSKPILLPSMGMAMTLFIINLQGAFHFTIWVLMFLAVMWMFHPSKRLTLALSLIGVQTLLLSAVRIGPAMMTFGGNQLDYVGGYESFWHLLNALMTLRTARFAPSQPIFSLHPINYWEYDMYITGFGVFFLLYFGIWRRMIADRGPAARRYRELDWPMLALFLLSLGSLFFVLFYETGFPVIGSAERSPSRFIIMPVIYLTVLSCIWFQKFLDERAGSMNAPIRLSIFLGILSATFLLLTHFRLWGIPSIERSGMMAPVEMAGTFEPAMFLGDATYIRVVNVAIDVTLISCAGWMLALILALLNPALRAWPRAMTSVEANPSPDAVKP